MVVVTVVCAVSVATTSDSSVEVWTSVEAVTVAVTVMSLSHAMLELKGPRLLAKNETRLTCAEWW